MFLLKAIRKIISSIVLIVVVISLFLLGSTWKAGNSPNRATAGVIVVLGAAQFDGRPSEVLEARLVEAKRIFTIGLAPMIFTVGGGAPGDRTTEAAASKKWLIAHGIAAAKIIAISQGRDTLVSTQSYVAQMRKRSMKTVIIVTDPYHCLRATTMAKDLGTIAFCSPVTTGPNSNAHPSLHYLVRETGAYLAYITLGRRGIHVSDHLNQ
ncbi:unannotated protein [freshwater metagenome]|uniref:Unannotated protein n=1 Tax=freshwater metagenome TaxID=449393 RepID=A0A6J6SDQ0_9ZZZZ|nr:YdcF family protein [Actinomycetota bacterium]MSV64425.1 YdcF family protein [Actinomycetota bacterium]MSW26303.1 YdcF family protein [Actinomycetota bacterium]MSW34620.1 YdcF family protein [Actinomycetota bacterium]MSX31646.1 YdcF family protein [Actinomycetota bacterium]